MKIDLPLPIVASNLMIEFSDFYENYQASTETLQCPRCSASVPANPGVCGNCGENVYQCHKCRYNEILYKPAFYINKELYVNIHNYTYNNIHMIFSFVDQSIMMRKTPFCAMLVAFVNTLASISCCMQSPAVLWIPLRMRKTGKR